MVGLLRKELHGACYYMTLTKQHDLFGIYQIAKSIEKFLNTNVEQKSTKPGYECNEVDNNVATLLATQELVPERSDAFFHIVGIAPLITPASRPVLPGFLDVHSRLHEKHELCRGPALYLADATAQATTVV